MPNASRQGTRALLGWAMYDWANSAFAAIIQTFVFAAYMTQQVAESEAVGSAWWGGIVCVASLVIALGSPILGAIADEGGFRKHWIAFFTLICVISTGLLWFILPSTTYMLPAAILVGVGIVGSEFAYVFYNAMLPGLAPHDKIGRWSGWGWALGYVGGTIALIVALFMLVSPEEPWLSLDQETFEHVRATFILTAVWYVVFSLPLFLWTPETRIRHKGPLAAVRLGINKLKDSLTHMRRYGHIVRFLIARMFYMDGLTTLFAFGGVYAAAEFGLSQYEVILFGIGLNLTGGIGAALFAFLDDRVGAKTTILLSLAGLAITGLGLLVVPTTRLFWIIGLTLGLFVGPIQASSRSYMARVAPQEIRTQMFGFFALSGKVTAFIGPAVVGWLIWATGDHRLGMSPTLVFVVIGTILMLTVPAEKNVDSSLIE